MASTLSVIPKKKNENWSAAKLYLYKDRYSIRCIINNSTPTFLLVYSFLSKCCEVGFIMLFYLLPFLQANVIHCRDPNALAYAIKRSCENKAEVVSLDEKESGLRATLNLGHTFGHVSDFFYWLYYLRLQICIVMSETFFRFIYSPVVWDFYNWWWVKRK